MKLFLAAGMVRTGSTWLYNVLRYAHLNAGMTVYGVYADDYDPAVVADVHVVKVHTYDDELRQRADIIFTNWRDLRDVAASMVRRGWIADEPSELVSLLRKNLATQYDAWKPYSDCEVQYREIVTMPDTVVEVLMERLCIADRFDVRLLARETVRDAHKITRIVAPQADPVTQLWPDHITDGRVGTYAKTLKQETIEAIE